jgi:tRNA(Ile)-lysidine synthetase-like protein
MAEAPYSKPSDIGGTLVRQVIALFKERSFPLPLTRPVFISVSGGVDSMVLAHLLANYGRKIIPKSQITLLHLDHGWRKESAREERKLVERMAKIWGVGFEHRKLAPPAERMSRNLEEDARLKRHSVYRELTHQDEAYVLTGHHESDAVESLFWRFLRGEFDEFRQGILFQDSNLLKPFLKVTKEQILLYSKAEKVDFLADPTNEDPSFFRAWVRKLVFPLLETQFPNVRKTLSGYLTKGESVTIDEELEITQAVQIVTGTSLNRAQRISLHQMVQALKPGGRFSLPGGRQIRRTSEGFLIEKLDESHRGK